MMRHWRLSGCVVLLFGVLAFGFGTSAASAAGIDCTRARSATEKAICASPALLALDRSIADAYADRLAQHPDQAGQARTELLAWLKHRDTTCTGPAAALEGCLSREMTTRLAALAPQAPAPTAQVASAPPAATQPATPPPAPVPPAGEATAPPPEPAVPSAANPPAAAAKLDAATVPAAGEQSTLLHVTSPGRFAIAAHSASGAALQLVDMMSGPSELSGDAGAQDGRIDRLLDVGTYKVRVYSAAGATGTVQLAVTAFADAAPPRALPSPGTMLGDELTDGRQRAFWLSVPPDGIVRIEAAGRSLADLRLWRNGRDLVDLAPLASLPEPVPGRPLTDLRLAGKVEPGTYLAVAYGGPATRWVDNNPAQPFHLRAGASTALQDGWASGTIGPFGSEVFSLPASAQMVRLDLPASAPASLSAGGAQVAIAKNSREPSATLDVPSDKPETIEVTGAAGQPYKLQALAVPPVTSISRQGTYWVSAVTAGAGGDEVPPSVLLQRTEPDGKPARILSTIMPVLTQSEGWHGQFNLRGPTTMLFQSAQGGALVVHSQGVNLQSTFQHAYNVPADFYALNLAPPPNQPGFVDLLVGPPGSNPAPVAKLPPNPVLPLGMQTVGPGQTLFLQSFRAPGATVGLSARPVPVALAQGALSVTLTTGATLAIPVEIAAGGHLSVSESGGEPVPFTQQNGSVLLAAADHPRTIVLAWHRDRGSPAAIPPPPPLSGEAQLAAGHPAYLDLGADEERGFALTVPEGGLYRIETLGRLHTAGSVSTPFIPGLGRADGNGVGQNMLIQSMLRAGRYRVAVRAQDSAGHLGVSATPAPLLAGATLLPGGSVRATLAAGSGVAFPIEIGGEAERYHFDVESLGRPWTGRIEDAEGWPVTRPGPLDGAELAMPRGRYRLVVEPDAVSRQVVARLSPVAKPVAIEGHGPHTLAFATPAYATWREPDGADRPRTPDRWTFALEGPADVKLSLSDGMAGELRREGADAVISRVAGTVELTLEAGHYRLDATSLGRNDRLAYTVSLTSPALQPGVPTSVTLPATVPFAIAEARIVSLTSFGTTPLKGVLKAADGSVVARIGPRPNDWNIAVSRPLPAGAYTLELATAAPPSLNPTSSSSASPDSSDNGDSSDSSDTSSNDDSGGDGQAAQTAATQTAGTQTAGTQKNGGDSGSDTSASSDAGDSSPDASDSTPAVTTEIRLALPAVVDTAAAPASPTLMTQHGVHVLALPQPQPGALVVAQARSDAETVLTLERAEGDGWGIVALQSGLAPLVASPADAVAQAWRIEAWTVDGGPEPIQLQARSFEVPVSGAGPVALTTLEATGIGGGSDGAGLSAAHIRLPDAGPVALSGNLAGLLGGGWPGHALGPVEAGSVLPEGSETWLLTPRTSTLQVVPKPFRPGEPAVLALSAGLVTPLPAQVAADGHVALWQAESGLGLPGLGADMGVATAGTLTLADRPTTVRNALGSSDLRLRLTLAEPALLPPRRLDAAWQASVPPGTAMPLTLPAGDKQLRMDLAPGLAVITNWQGQQRSTVWTGGAPVSRFLNGNWTELLLVSLGQAAAPASLSWQPAPAAGALQAGSVFKRFFGAAGSLELTAEAAPGAQLHAAGNATLTAILADGRVARGQDVSLAEAPPGPTRVVVDVTPGAMAVWESADGVSPWPTVAAAPTALPAQLTLSGPAMALALRQNAPLLLHASTTAPVLLELAHPGQASTPELFAVGAEFNRLMPAGAAELRLYSPHDGPLSGSMALSADPVTPIAEGLGAPVSVGPGGSAVFGFTLAKAATIGVGVQATPDVVSVRLLDASGQVLGVGVAQLQQLAAGDYALEVHVPPDAATTILRPAIIGITPRGNGPPPDVVQGYLELVGMKPQGTP